MWLTVQLTQLHNTWMKDPTHPQHLATETFNNLWTDMVQMTQMSMAQRLRNQLAFTLQWLGQLWGAELADSFTQVGVASQQNAQDVPEAAADSALAFLVALEKRARACGIGPSEWYEVRNRPLLDVLRFVEAFGTPNSSGAASSG